MRADDPRLNEISERIIGAAFRVANVLGVGFLERVYENALAHELKKLVLAVEQQKSIEVHYDGAVVGLYVADLVVAGVVIVETKAIAGLDDIHLAQALNYLKATGSPLALLINFGTSRVQVKRVAAPLTNSAV